jgi:hypothetical protein
MVAKGMLLLQAMSSTPLGLPDSDQSIPLASNTEELKYPLSFQEVIGYGQQSGCFQNSMNTVTGLLQVKSTLWNQEGMTSLAQQVVSTHLDPLSIGVQTGLKTNTQRHRRPMFTQQVLTLNSTHTVFTGTKTDSTHT